MKSEEAVYAHISQINSFQVNLCLGKSLEELPEIQIQVCRDDLHTLADQHPCFGEVSQTCSLNQITNLFFVVCCCGFAIKLTAMIQEIKPLYKAVLMPSDHPYTAFTDLPITCSFIS